MKLSEYFIKIRRSIDAALNKYLPSEKERSGTLAKAMRYSVFSGGKRIRPIIAIESSNVLGGNIHDAMPVACSIELIHTYSLIHDDLPSMDNDDTRRGKPTSHKMFGEANAILAGDALLTLAFNILAGISDAKVAQAAAREISEAAGTGGMLGGQVLDLELDKRKKTRIMLDDINRLKTAKLFEVSARAGAISARAGKKDSGLMAIYGLNLGMAFQIIDDIMDEEGYLASSGMESSEEEAKNLINFAKESLKGFGKKADRLREIADFVLARTS